jgi:hypothetical protein
MSGPALKPVVLGVVAEVEGADPPPIRHIGFGV